MLSYPTFLLYMQLTSEAQLIGVSSNFSTPWCTRIPSAAGVHALSHSYRTQAPVRLSAMRIEESLQHQRKSYCRSIELGQIIANLAGMLLQMLHQGIRRSSH
jgi:hypothetical protein